MYIITIVPEVWISNSEKFWFQTFLWVRISGTYCTVEGRNPNAQISALEILVRLSNSLGPGICPKTKPKSSISDVWNWNVWFGPNCLKSERSVTEPYQPARTTEIRTIQNPNHSKSEPFKIRTKFCSVVKPNVWFSALYCTYYFFPLFL